MLNEICKQYYKEIISVAKHLEPQLHDDLAAETFILILEGKIANLESAHEKGQAFNLIKRVMLNNSRSSTSRFYYAYKKNNLKNDSIDSHTEL